MKRQPAPFHFLLVIIAVSVLLMPVHAVFGASGQPDITIKINRIEHTLNMIDGIVASGSTQAVQPPTAFIRAMLQGSGWIDPNRSIVIGITFKHLQFGQTHQAPQTPTMAALIPFATPNDNFRIAYNAVSGDDYYIVPLPPGKAEPLTEQMERGLVSASRGKPEGILSAEVAVSQLLKKADQQIQKLLLDLEQKTPKQQQGTGLTPRDAKQVIQNLLNAAAQMRTVRMGLDITEKDLVISTGLEAAEGTDLYRLLDRPAESYSSFFADYLPRYQINFRSGSYNIEGMLDFFNLMFGEFYKKIGMDLAEIKPMALNFTGEMAGGMSFNNNGMDFEMIMVRNKTEKPGEEFLETEYIPWIMDYGREITNIVNNLNPEISVKNPFAKTPGSVIGGHKVFGIKGQIPPVTPVSGGKGGFVFNMRIASVDPFIMTASSDERLGHLIQIAKTLEKQPTAGPLMQAEIDMGSFVQAIRESIPGSGLNAGGSFPELGRLFYTLDMKSGSLDTKYRIRIDDIKSMTSSFKRFAVSPVVAGKGFPSSGPAFPQTQPRESRGYEQKQPARLSTDDPRYWINKGLLFATYGNDKEAVKHFKKAIGMDPENSSAYFNMGLSYSETGEYEKAINAIQKAVKLKPDNGEYYYGLGWVYLLAGDKTTALKDIRKAAELGSMDAKRYLRRNACKAR